MKRSFLLSGPLKGIRVLDFSRVLAGPYCSQMLADMGAEVIKVEEPRKGDDTRSWGPPFIEGESAYFISLNRNKLSLGLDLKHEYSKDIINRLVQRSDIVIENFITGKADTLGISYKTVSTINPRIIYCSISGFGSTGTLAKQPGYDAIISAMYGMMHITGMEGINSSPVKPGVAVTDVLTGILAHGAIVAALYERTNSGLGQHIETSLMEAQLSSLVYIASNYLLTGVDRSQKWGTGHPSIVPYQTFECEDGKHIFIAVGNDSQFSKFCSSVKQDFLAFDAKYKTNKDRVANRSTLVPLLQSLIKKKPSAEWLATFQIAGIPSGPVRNIEESFKCPQVADRDMIQYVDHPKCGRIAVVGPPVKFSRTPCDVTRAPPPLLGEHTRYVLKDILGFSEEEIGEMEKINKIL